MSDMTWAAVATPTSRMNTKDKKPDATIAKRLTARDTGATIAAFVKLSDLPDQRTIVIHTGLRASRDGEKRSIYQRAHNHAITENNTLDPEIEPEQTLYVSASQLDAGGKLYPMADKDATKKIIVHIYGQLPFEKIERLVRELRRQAPNATMYRGCEGQNAEPWEDMVCYLDEKANVEAENRPSRFTIISGYSGFDKQASYLVKGLIPAESTCSIFGIYSPGRG